MTSDLSNSNTSCKASILCDNLKGLASFLSSKLNRVQLCVFKLFYYQTLSGLIVSFPSFVVSKKRFQEEVWKAECAKNGDIICQISCTE